MSTIEWPFGLDLTGELKLRCHLGRLTLRRQGDWKRPKRPAATNGLPVHMPHIELTLVIGDYAQRWHLPSVAPAKLTATVADWRSHWPAVLPMPHPSPRNNIWLKINPWFVADVVPALQVRVAKLLSR